MVNIYRALHHIVGVCSVWREAGLSHRALWSLIPTLHRSSDCHFITEKSTRLCLERAGSELHLAAKLKHYVDSATEEALSLHGSRFRTINIQVSDLSVIEEALALVVDNSAPGLLTDLSVWLDSDDSDERSNHSAGDYIFSEDTSHRVALEQIISSLCVLRLRSVNIHMVNLSFKHLVHLRLQDMVFGHEIHLHDFLRALASASQLRELEIISVIAWTGDGGIEDGSEDSDDDDDDAFNQLEHSVVLPGLQRLFLEDLYVNVIRTILHTIATGPYGLEISLTDKWHQVKRRRTASYCGINRIRSAVQGHDVGTVMFGARFSMLDTHITLVLSAIPTATTLHIDDQYITPISLRAMTRTRNASSSRFALPKFRAIHMSRCLIESIKNPTPFKKMIASYPLEEFCLGGALTDEGNGGEEIDFDEPDQRPSPLYNTARLSSTLTWVEVISKLAKNPAQSQK
ncbi:unnamed protein product [Rhizoctonia solani]|uniref:Uncharacterized protein n=1 Tax=Rhizoctonia solani TaxID=456999 RepID=A0A8H3B762_9AGAM|nr:unnamed protein product [Rhizoctonia solani]